MPRLYEPYGLTKREKRDKARVKGKCPKGSQARYCRVVRCIKKVEKRCRKKPSQCPRSPVAVCRTAIYKK